MKKTKKRFLALLLVVSLAIPNVSYVSADDATPSDAETVSEHETSTEIPDTEHVILGGDGNVVGEDTAEKDLQEVTEDITEVVSEKDIEEAETEASKDPAEVVTSETATTEMEEAVLDEATSEDVISDDTKDVVEEKQPTFTAPVEGVDVSGIDFSSKQLLVGTEDEDIFTWDTVVLSSYNGIYLTEYASEEETKNAYSYYYGKADFVDANITFSVSDNEGSEDEPKDTADLSEINTGDDAISNLNDMDTAGTVPAGTIAVIDTGSNGDVSESVSIIGDSISDDNGHGTRVIETIKSVYPEAKIISIKALGSDGKCDVATLYAAISYAIERKVSIINLSVSSVGVAESDTIREVVDRAVDNGIIVVGAAGNNGKNAKYYVPGGIDSAIIVGSYNEDAEKNNSSNYGPTVDYYLKANSTSIAAAKMSAIIAKDGIESIANQTDKGYIYYPSSDNSMDISEAVDYKHDNAIYFEGAANRNAGVAAPTWYNDVKSYITGTLGMTIDIDYGYWSASSYTTYEVCATLVSKIINNSYPSEYHITATDSAPTLYNQLVNSSKWSEVTSSWNYHTALFNSNLIDQIRPGDVIVWANTDGGSASHVEIATLSGTAYNNGAGEGSTPIYGYRRWVDWEYKNDNGVGGTTSTGQYFRVFRPIDEKDYYISIKKVDSRGYVMNGVTFSVSYHDNDTNTDVTIPGGYINGKYSGIWTGYRIDTKDTYGTSYRDTDYEGVGVFYLGKFSSAPTNIKVTENWRGRNIGSYSDTGSGWVGGRAEIVTKLKTSSAAATRENVYSKDYAPNESTKSISTTYQTEQAAKDAAKNSSNENGALTQKNWHYAYTTLMKQATNKSYVTGNSNYSLTGIKYGLYGDSACTELIATVTLTDNGDGTAKIASLDDITINKTSTNNNSEPYKVTIDGYHSIGGLIWGTYYWKETYNPGTSGYNTNTASKAATLNVSYTSTPLVITDTDTEESGKIRIHKLLTGNGSSGASAAGATYEIKGTGSLSSYSGTFTIGSNGYSDYKNLMYGTYTIKEKTVPTTAPSNGYWSIDTTTYTVTLTKNGGTKTVSSSTAVSANDATVQSTDTAYQYYYVSVKKVDQSGNTMNGVTFDLTVNGGTTKTKAMTTGKYVNGSTTSNTTAGIATYYLGAFTSAPTVVIKENWTSDGYILNQTIKTVTAYTSKADAESHAGSFLFINQGTTYVKLTKTSANPTCTNGNPNYSLVGTTFKMYKTRAEARNAIDSSNYGTALATFTITASNISNNQGIKNLDISQWMDKNTDGTFKNTTFYFVESAAGKNYHRSEDISAVIVTASNTSTNPAQLIVSNTPVNDPFEIEIMKMDKLTGSNVVPEGKSLAGAKFKVDFYAADIDTVLANANGNIASYLAAHYTPSTTYSTTVTITKNANGNYRAKVKSPVDNGNYPIGFITITEITPPTDYSLDGSMQYLNGDSDYDVTGNLAFVTYGTFSNNNATFTPQTYHPYTARTLAQLTSTTGSNHGILVSDGENAGLTFNISVDNTPIRGNLRLTKLTYDGTALENVEFEIKNNATGETHTIVTDAEGNATTVGNEDAWFSLLDDGTNIAYNADYGCLPAGTYTVTEKRCEANEGLQLLKPATVTISSTATILVAEADGKLYNIEMPEITTTARVVETDSKTLAQMGEPQTIEDVVAYKNLRADTTYTLVGRLMVRHPDGTYEVYKKNGTAYTVKKTFTTGATWTKSEFEKSGTVTVNYEGIYAENYEGCSFVVFEKLYLGTTVPDDDSDAAQYQEYEGSDETIFPVVHENIDDEGQTVRPVDIHTTIADNAADDRIGYPEETVTITDRVYYTGLTIGEEYTISGTLHVTGYSWKDADGNIISTVEEDDTLLDAEGNPVTAEKTFTAETNEGYIDLEFTLDASLLEGESVVAFESLYYKEKEIAVHADITDEDETVHFPMIHTTLYREGTGEWAEDYDETDPTNVTTVDEASKEIMAAEDAVVVDRIKYHNLIAGRSYVVKGILMDKETKEPLLDAEGNKIEVEQIFTLESVDEVIGTDSPDAGDYILADGTVLDMSSDHSIQLVDGYFEVTFPAFDASEMGNKKAVAFEEVYLLTSDDTEDYSEDDLVLVSDHKDIDDVDQTVRFVDIHTNAAVEETNTKMVPLEGPVTINDTVSYKNLIPGMEYTLTATPVVKGDSTGTYEDGDQLLDKNSKPVTASITFTPEEADGEVVVPITFEGYLIPEIEIVCYETMTNYKGLDIAIHNDIDDEEQTVIVVKVSTTAKDSVTEDNESLATEETVIIDTVAYEGLEEGLTYHIVGTLMQRSTEEPVLVADGNPLIAEVTFEAEESEGTIDITFPAFNAVGLALDGDSVVVFEKIYLVKEEKGDTEETTEIFIGHHEDIEDEGQTVNIPKIHTTASDSETEDHVGTVGEKVTIVDVVTYKNLKNKEYTVNGVLMDKETGKELLINGKPVTSQKTFTPEEPYGTVELIFTLDSSALAGKSSVVFESIYRNDKLVAVHNDLEDSDQEIDFPKIRTKAEDAVTKEDIGEANRTTTIIDTVSYTNLLVGEGKEYTVKGVLMDRDTGKELLIDEKPVTAEKTFIPAKPDGTVELEFTFDGSALKGEVVVVFEDLYHNDKKVYSHTDLTDTEQTVYYPSVHTHVEDTTKTVQKASSVTVKDDVMYSKLKVGETYMLEGILMDKSTGKAVMIGGLPVKVQRTFKAEAEDGMITMEFNFDATGLDGDVTVFEYIYLVKDKDNKDLKYYLVAEHTDLEDKEQTFMISPVPKTGDDTPIKVLFGLLLLSGLGLAYILFKKRKLNF